MLNISEELKDEFKKTSVYKKLIIRFPNGEHDDITNDQILSESMVIRELLSSQDELRFGTCNATIFEVTVAEVVANIKGCRICPVLALNDNEIPLGEYIVTEVEKNAGKPYKKVTALTRMKDFDKDVKAWYGNLKFPMTLKAFRDSLLNHIGLQQVATTLVNDNIVLEQTLDATGTINGLELIQAICDVNGVFGTITRDGKFKYVSLNVDYGLYPSETLYPAEDLYPSDGMGNELNALLKSAPIIDDYETYPINGCVIGDNEMYYETTNHVNPYIIRDNPLLYDRKDLKDIAERIASKINGIFYRPAEIVSVGLPYIELGDVITCSRKADLIETIVLERTLKGIQSLTDTYKARGQEFFSKDYNSIGDKLKRLNRQYGQVKTSVEATDKGLALEVQRASSAEGNLQTAINVLSDEVGIKVSSNGTVTSNLTLDKNGMAFTGNKLVINTTNFKLNADGSVSVTGAVNATSGSFTGSVTSNDSLKIYNSNTKKNSSINNSSVNTYAINTYNYSDGTISVTSGTSTTKTDVLSLSSLGGYTRVHGALETSNDLITNTKVVAPRMSGGTIVGGTGAFVNGQIGASGTLIKSITAGSKITTVNGNSAVILDGAIVDKDIFFVTNGDGNANGAHIEGTTILGGKAYAVFDRTLANVQTRINWVRITLA